MVFHWIEIIKFIRNNWVKIIIGTMLFAGGYTIIVNKPFINEEVELANNEEVIEELEDITDVRPANFYLFIEQEDGTSFKNNLLIEQYILSKEVLDSLSTGLNLNLVKLIEESENIITVNYNDSGKSKMIGVSRNESTSLIEVFVNIGNERENLATVHQLFEYITSNQVPFLTNKKIYIFKEPSLKEINNNFDVLSEEQATTSSDNIKIDLFVGVVLGLSIVIFILWIITLFDSKLSYSFSYLLKDSDDFILVDKLNNNDQDLKYLLALPKTDNRIIINQNKYEADNLVTKNAINYMKNDELVEVTNEITNISKVEKNTQLIYLIEEGATTRKWYNKQRRYDQLLDIPVLIIQVNKK